MFVKCINPISVFKVGKCYNVVRGYEYEDTFTLYHEDGCGHDENLPLENFVIIPWVREGVLSYLIGDNNHDCPLGVALEYSYKDGVVEQFFHDPTPSQERYLTHKLDEWETAWNREELTQCIGRVKH